MKKLLAIFLSIAFTGLVLQSCGAKNSETADSTNTEANEEEMVDQQSESEFPYELVPLKEKNYDGSWSRSGLAVKQGGKFVSFDNDADYSGLSKEGQLYKAINYYLPSDVSDEELKTIAHLIQQYLRDKSKIREHELFTDIDKAYYNCSEYFSGDYYLESMVYHSHTYTNGAISPQGYRVIIFIQTPEKFQLEDELQTLDGEIVPADALILNC